MAEEFKYNPMEKMNNFQKAGMILSQGAMAFGEGLTGRPFLSNFQQGQQNDAKLRFDAWQQSQNMDLEKQKMAAQLPLWEAQTDNFIQEAEQKKMLAKYPFLNALKDPTMLMLLSSNPMMFEKMQGYFSQGETKTTTPSPKKETPKSVFEVGATRTIGGKTYTRNSKGEWLPS